LKKRNGKDEKSAAWEKRERQTRKGFYLVSLLAAETPEISSLERSEEGGDFRGFKVVGSSGFRFSRGKSSEEDVGSDSDGDWGREGGKGLFRQR